MPKLSDTERHELCEQMDKDLDDFIEQKKRESEKKIGCQPDTEKFDEDIDTLAEVRE